MQLWETDISLKECQILHLSNLLSKERQIVVVELFLYLKKGIDFDCHFL